MSWSLLGVKKKKKPTKCTMMLQLLVIVPMKNNLYQPDWQVRDVLLSAAFDHQLQPQLE